MTGIPQMGNMCLGISEEDVNGKRRDPVEDASITATYSGRHVGKMDEGDHDNFGMAVYVCVV